MQPADIWRQSAQRYRLEGAKCTGCNRTYIPPRLVCPECKGREFETVRLPRTGEIVTYTQIHVAANQFTQEVPFAIGIVELDDGTRVTSQIVECDAKDLREGLRVRCVFRRIQEDGENGVIAYGYKFTPISTQEERGDNQ